MPYHHTPTTISWRVGSTESTNRVPGACTTRLGHWGCRHLASSPTHKGWENGNWCDLEANRSIALGWNRVHLGCLDGVTFEACQQTEGNYSRGLPNHQRKQEWVASACRQEMGSTAGHGRKHKPFLPTLHPTLPYHIPYHRHHLEGWIHREHKQSARCLHNKAWSLGMQAPGELSPTQRLGERQLV